MIRVLVVEDELPTARLVAKLVRQHPDFSVVGVEMDGESALQFLRSNPVDLIITDIQMPIMDGLQLLEAVYREYPSCLTVMLTGFSQFDYARTALHLRAFDYLLKPIDNQEFARVLEQARKVITQRRREQTRQLVRQALAGMPADADGCMYQLLLAEASAGFWYGEAWSQCRKQFGPDAMEFPGAADRERILVAPAMSWKPGRTVPVWPPDHCVNVICCTNPVPLSALKQTAEVLRQALFQQAVLFQSHLFWFDSALPVPQRRDQPLRQMQPELAAAAVCAADRPELERCLRQMWQVSQAYGSLRADVQAYLSAVIMDPRVCQQITPEQLHELQSRIQCILQDAGTPQQCTAELCGCLAALRQDPVSKRDVARQMEEIAHYLKTNYHRSISIETLARQYGFVPKTLNRLFRQYQGSRPAEYLLNLRIRQARHLLETRPDLMIKDVAASVGYADHHYFSKVFQRATGHWPTEYQNKAQKQK